MKLLTWNVYFGGHMFEERRDALVAELGRRRPEVIALQEVTPELHAALAAAPWVRAEYRLSDDDGSTLGDYGVLILARSPVKVKGFHHLDLPTEMGRRLLVADLAGGLCIATVHLESTAYASAARAAQLRIILPYLTREKDDICLVGDMNFSPGDTLEEAALDGSFLDVWPALHPRDPGYTVDTTLNTMRFQLKSKDTQKRIDRIFLRSQRWRATSIELVGTAAFDIDGTFISDHFGLEAELSPA